MTRLPEIIQKYEPEILADWMKEQLAAVRRRDLMNDAELREQSTTLLRELAKATVGGGVDTTTPALSAMYHCFIAFRRRPVYIPVHRNGALPSPTGDSQCQFPSSAFIPAA